MTTIREWFQASHIEFHGATIVFDEYQGDYIYMNAVHPKQAPDFGVAFPSTHIIEGNEPFLDAEFSDTYGLQSVPDFTLWSNDHVCTVGEYDGSTWLNVIARNPPEA
jgi:hypothetical protein